MSPTSDSSLGRPSRGTVLIFDLGGVLVEVEKSRSEALWETRASESDLSFESAFMGERLKNRFNEGSIDAATFIQTVVARASEAGVRLQPCDIQPIWTAMLRPKPYAEALLYGLAKNHDLAVLSDTDPLHVAHMEAHFGFFHRFAVKTYSYSVGAVKPSPRMYEAVVDALGVIPSQCLFFDDREKNIVGARRAGLRAYLTRCERDILDALAHEQLGLHGSS